MVRTKAYTINRLIEEVRGLNTRKVYDFDSLVNNLSPRKGLESTKVQVLDRFLSGLTYDLANGFIGNETRSVKQRVIAALKARKKYGTYLSY